MTAYADRLRAAADLVDAAADSGIAATEPYIYVDPDHYESPRIVLQFDKGDVAAVEAWGGLLADAVPGEQDGRGYREIGGTYSGVPVNAWCPVSDYAVAEFVPTTEG